MHKQIYTFDYFAEFSQSNYITMIKQTIQKIHIELEQPNGSIASMIRSTGGLIFTQIFDQSDREIYYCDLQSLNVFSISEQNSRIYCQSSINKCEVILLTTDYLNIINIQNEKNQSKLLSSYKIYAKNVFNIISHEKHYLVCEHAGDVIKLIVLEYPFRIIHAIEIQNYEQKKVQKYKSKVVLYNSKITSQLQMNIFDFKTGKSKKYIVPNINQNLKINSLHEITDAEYLIYCVDESDKQVLIVVLLEQYKQKINIWRYFRYQPQVRISFILSTELFIFIFVKEIEQSGQSDILTIQKIDQELIHRSKWTDSADYRYWPCQHNCFIATKKVQHQDKIQIELRNIGFHEKSLYVFMLNRLGISSYNMLQAIMESFEDI